MKLRDLLGQDVLGDDATIEPAVAALDVSGVALDSRVVKPGDLFFALAGSKTDGARFIASAIAAGAVAVAGDHPPQGGCTVPFVAVSNPRRAGIPSQSRRRYRLRAAPGTAYWVVLDAARIRRSGGGRSKRGSIPKSGPIRAMTLPAVGTAFQPDVMNP